MYIHINDDDDDLYNYLYTIPCIVVYFLVRSDSCGDTSLTLSRERVVQTANQTTASWRRLQLSIQSNRDNKVPLMTLKTS